MQPINYARATDVATALAASADPHSAFLAGGTTLIDLMKLDVLTPRSLIDINHLPLAEIESTSDRLRLGALARMSDAADNAVVRACAPAIVQALEASASGQLRNMATLGGNLLQRTRCAYFRDTSTACNKRRPGTGCGARTGVNEEHAVLGTSEQCIAVHASDFAVPLMALDASIQVRGAAGERSIPIAEFFCAPGETPERETSLRQGELIVWIEIARSAAAANSVYLKVRERSSYAFALTSCAAAMVRADDGRMTDVRLALGGVATIPWRAQGAEECLRGELPGGEIFAEAARAAFTQARPTQQNAYKLDLGIATIVRALETVCA